MRRLALLIIALVLSAPAQAALKPSIVSSTATADTTTTQPNTNNSCLGGKIQRADNGTLVCVTNPIPHVVMPPTTVIATTNPINVTCPDGAVLTSIRNNVGTCMKFEAPKLTITCPPGQFLYALNEGNPVCTQAIGGTYVTNASNACVGPVNALTGLCSCPSGYKAFESLNIQGQYRLYICYKS